MPWKIVKTETEDETTLTDDELGKLYILSMYNAMPISTKLLPLINSMRYETKTQNKQQCETIQLFDTYGYTSTTG
jgi:hypothetical protein